MTLELHVFPPSPRSFKVMVIANYLELPHELKFVDLVAGAQKSPAFAALNANMRVPVLREGDYVLWESNAILQYLASKKPEIGLLPQNERVRLEVLRWQFWDLAHWDPACAALIFEYVAKRLVRGDAEPDEATVAKGTEAFHRVAGVLDGWLHSRAFVAGDVLTVADFSLGAALNLGEQAHIPVEPYDEVRRWYASLSALPAWQRTRAQIEANYARSAA